MSIYRNEIDFIERTKKIFENLSDDRLDKTFFLNCCVGLLIAPQQYTSRSQQQLSLGTVDIENWGIDVSKCTENKATKWSADSVENIAYHFRNSLCHYRFDVKDCNPNGTIENITIIDKASDDKNAPTTFELTLSFDNFKKFVLKYADTLVEQLKQ